MSDCAVHYSCPEQPLVLFSNQFFCALPVTFVSFSSKSVQTLFFDKVDKRYIHARILHMCSDEAKLVLKYLLAGRHR